MSLRSRVFLYLFALHAIFLAFSFALFGDSPFAFVGVELLLLVSLAGGIYLFRRAFESILVAQRFRELLQENNYSGRLKSDGDQEANELINVFNALLDSLHAEHRAMGEQRGFLERLLEATPSAVIVFDFDGVISLSNSSANRLLGFENPVGRPLHYWIDHPDTWPSTVDETERARHLSLLFQLEQLPRNQKRLFSDVAGRRFRAQRGQFYDRGFLREFLLLEELTAELEGSERAAYETLVRVLAHEVNNTVAATGSVLDSLLHYQPQLETEDRNDYVTAITAAKRRNANLGSFIERFTNLIRMPAPELRPHSLREILNDTLWMCRDQGREHNITVAWRRCDEPTTLMLDAQLMEQALINILKNAIEAAQARCIQTGVSGGYVYLDLIAADSDNSPSILRVTDSGQQLQRVPAQQLFSPFFTTKKGGQGLGLMFTREVLNRHGFQHRLYSNQDGETCFEIQLST